MPNIPSGNEGDTIVSIPKSPHLAPLLHDPGDLDEGERLSDARFKIRLANTLGRRSTASYLIERRYAWRGYQTSPIAPNANLITLAAFDKDHPIATISVGLDSPAGLGVEELYPDEVKRLRGENVRLCEFTKLAVDNMIRSKAVLAAIFHIAYIHGRRLFEATDVLIEVNPRHVRFYQSMLGFDIVGDERLDPRVSAPALLLRLPLGYAEQQIAIWGGHRERAAETRLLYPLFFSPDEEKGIEGRLRAIA